MKILALFLSLAATAAAAPNILFIISDDLQACLGCYGNPVCETPHIDRLAREGVRFEHAYCQYPLCGPSRASLMSGLYPGTNGITGNSSVIGSFRKVNPKLADHPSMAGFLREQGYFSARVSKIYHMGVPGGIERGDPGGDDPDSWDYRYDVMGPETLSPGLRELLSPKARHYGSSFATTIVPDELAQTQADAMATTQAIAILESRARPVIEGASNKRKQKPDSPFFLAVGLVRPHVPLVAPKRHFDRYPPDRIKLPAVPEGDLEDVPAPAFATLNETRFKMNELQQRKAIAAYYASVSYMDEQVGRLLDTLDRLKLRKDTIVIFTADHGWNLGEHGCWQKSTLWEEATRVALIISAPGFEASAGKTAPGIAELIDLYPTLADLAGLKEKAPARLQGKSLRPMLEDPAMNDPAWTAYTRVGKGRSIRRGGWRYSHWGKSGEELYYLEKDPHEFTNLARDPAHREQRNNMRALLEQKTTLEAAGPGRN